MRQLINLAYAVRAEGYLDEDAFARFHAELHLEPGETYRPKQKIDDSLLSMMDGPG